MAKIALITGATSGIGKATAQLLADEGYKLIITGRRGDRLRDVKHQIEREYKTDVLALSFDIRDRRQCEATLGSLPKEYRDIDVLVNNAGLAAGADPIFRGDPNDWDAMIDTNIKGMLYMIRLVGAGMAAHRSGHIVNLGSIVGTQPNPNGAVYSATKHAVRAITQSIRAEFLGTGVRVTEIRPGMTETEFAMVRFHGDRAQADRMFEGIDALTGEDVAEAIVWALNQPRHVNIDEIMITPVQQASVYYVHREQK